jgi:hypothetical protein
MLPFLSCSSDDTSSDTSNDDQTDNEILKIFRLTETSHDYTFIRYYNENGTIIRELGMNVGDNENDRPYTLYEYDNLQNLKSLKFYSENDEFVRDYRTYEYDGSNRLTMLTDYGDGSNSPYHTIFTYGPNRIDFEEPETERFGSIVFDDHGRIIETNHKNSPSSFLTHFISYNTNGQVLEIRQGEDITFTYETDNSANPMFQFFISKPVQYMLSEHYLYDIDFTFDTSYSIHNVTKISKHFNTSLLGTEEMTFQYNTNGYPISSTTVRQDGSLIERTFEYY